MPYLNRRSLRVFYEVEGQGPTVVMIHGLLGDRTMWRKAGYVQAMRGYRCVLFDDRGRGKSDLPSRIDGYRFSRRVEDLRALLDHLGCERAAFWGFSSGSPLAFLFAARHPDRVTGVIASGWNAEFSDDSSLVADVHYFRIRGLRGVCDDLAERESRSLPTWMERQFLATPMRSVTATFLSERSEGPPEKRLANLRSPCLFVVGENEGPASENVRLSRLPNTEVLVVPKSGHIGAYLQARRVVPTVRKFLARTC